MSSMSGEAFFKLNLVSRPTEDATNFWTLPMWRLRKGTSKCPDDVVSFEFALHCNTRL